MKKLMFLTMVFGLMMVFSGSASAQTKGVVVDVNGSGKFKPVTTDTFRAGYITPSTDNPRFGIKKNQRYCSLSIQRGQGQQVSTLLEMDCNKASVTFQKVRITKIENSGNFEIINNDTLLLDDKTVTFFHGGKMIIKVFYTK